MPIGRAKYRVVRFSYDKLAAAVFLIVCLLRFTHQGSCCCTRHPDIGGSPLACVFPDRFGFGSVHYVRDFGDTVKLVHAMGRVEADGQVRKYYGVEKEVVSGFLPFVSGTPIETD